MSSYASDEVLDEFAYTLGRDAWTVPALTKLWHEGIRTVVDILLELETAGRVRSFVQNERSCWCRREVDEPENFVVNVVAPKEWSEAFKKKFDEEIRNAKP